MLNIAVTIDMHEIKDMVEKRQVPYALSRTLTDLGRAANRANIEHAKSEYMIRRPWVLKGFQSTSANKNRLETVIRHRDSYMLKHERGDMVRSLRGKFNAVPQRDKRTNARASLALKDPRTFFAGKSIIRRKFGTRQYELLFKLTEEAQYAPTLKMEEIAQAIVDEKADAFFHRHWLEAINHNY